MRSLMYEEREKKDEAPEKREEKRAEKKEKEKESKSISNPSLAAVRVSTDRALLVECHELLVALALAQGLASHAAQFCVSGIGVFLQATGSVVVGGGVLDMRQLFRLRLLLGHVRCLQRRYDDSIAQATLVISESLRLSDPMAFSKVRFILGVLFFFLIFFFLCLSATASRLICVCLFSPRLASFHLLRPFTSDFIFKKALFCDLTSLNPVHRNLMAFQVNCTPKLLFSFYFYFFGVRRSSDDVL